MAVGSFSAGLSGLAAHATALNVIGNNLANINTVGYKASTVSFQDLVSQTIGGASGTSQIGLGVVTGAIAPVFSQGSIENSRESTNVAIQGNGFFIVNNNDGASAYTRAGNFSFNADGELVTPDGFKVQGYTQIDPATGRVVTTGEPTDIVVPPGVLRAPVATTQFQIASNLDSDAATGATFTGSVQIYDSLGAPHVLTITYTKTGPSAWSYEVTVPGAEVTPAPAGGAPAVVAGGTLTFNANGQIATITPTAPSTGGGSAAPGPITDITFAAPAWANGAAAGGNIVWDIVDANQIVSITGFSSPSATSSKSQNGAPAGLVDSISISSDGTIMATFGAGQTVAVAQLALANFNNPKGLVKLGANKFGESLAAGLPNVGVAGQGGRGTLIGAALEQSNVDIAQEFTQMILAQRGYQANSKSITVSDEILIDTLNIKR
jgi:flagellar hook protein FlgE